MKFITPEASSACSERHFSGGKLVFETKCNRLGDENFENYYYLILTKTSNSAKVCLTKKNIDTAIFNGTNLNIHSEITTHLKSKEQALIERLEADEDYEGES